MLTRNDRHQRQALTFFLRRERGMHPNKDGVGIWLLKISKGQSTCVSPQKYEWDAMLNHDVC